MSPYLAMKLLPVNCPFTLELGLLYQLYFIFKYDFGFPQLLKQNYLDKNVLCFLRSLLMVLALCFVL